MSGPTWRGSSFQRRSASLRPSPGSRIFISSRCERIRTISDSTQIFTAASRCSRQFRPRGAKTIGTPISLPSPRCARSRRHLSRHRTKTCRLRRSSRPRRRRKNPPCSRYSTSSPSFESATRRARSYTTTSRASRRGSAIPMRPSTRSVARWTTVGGICAPPPRIRISRASAAVRIL